MNAPAAPADVRAGSSWTGPIGPVRLVGRRQPYRANVAACAAEIRAIPLAAWTPLTMHLPSGRIWPVAWSAHSLRGYSKDPLDVHSPTTRKFRVATQGIPVEAPAPQPGDLGFTEAASAFPACLAMAERIPGASERIRILQLGPGGILPKHRDPLHEPRWEDRSIIRFHIPIIAPESYFFSWDRSGQVHQVCDPPGSVWFIDTDSPHMAVNASTEPRYHLVVDKFLDPELRRVLEPAPLSLEPYPGEHAPSGGWPL